MAEDSKPQNVTRLTQDKSLGEKMKLVAGLYAKKMGRAVENSTPFQMAREVRDDWREFKSDVRDLGDYAGQEWRQTKKRVRVNANLAKRRVKNGMTAAKDAVLNSAPANAARETWGGIKEFGNNVKDGFNKGVNWIEEAPGRAKNYVRGKIKDGASWVKGKVKQGASWVGGKLKQGAKAAWNWLKNTKAAKTVVKGAKTVAKGARAVGKAAVKTAVFVATPAIVTYKAGKAAYDAGKAVYNKGKDWFNEKAEVAARLEAAQNKPNEQVKEAVDENVHSDAVNEKQTQNQTEQQKEQEDVSAKLEEQGDTRTEETQEQEPATENQPVQKDNEKTDPLKEIDPETLAKIDKERAALESTLVMNEKSGRPVNRDELTGMFGQELTDKGKEGFGLSAAQAAAYKAQYPDLFPNEEKQKAAENAEKQSDTRETEEKQQPVLGKEQDRGENKQGGKPAEQMAGQGGEKPRDTNEMRDSILSKDNENQSQAESKPKTDYMEKYDINNNDMFKQRLGAYKVKGLQGNEDAEFKYALGIEKLMTLPEEKGGLGLNPKTPEGAEAIAGLKAQMYEQHGIKSFAPEKTKTRENGDKSHSMSPNVAQRMAQSKAAVNN